MLPPEFQCVGNGRIVHLLGEWAGEPQSGEDPGGRRQCLGPTQSQNARLNGHAAMQCRCDGGILPVRLAALAQGRLFQKTKRGAPLALLPPSKIKITPGPPDFRMRHPVKRGTRMIRKWTWCTARDKLSSVTIWFKFVSLFMLSFVLFDVWTPEACEAQALNSPLSQTQIHARQNTGNDECQFEEDCFNCAHYAPGASIDLQPIAVIAFTDTALSMPSLDGTPLLPYHPPRL